MRKQVKLLQQFLIKYKEIIKEFYAAFVGSIVFVLLNAPIKKILNVALVEPILSGFSNSYIWTDIFLTLILLMFTSKISLELIQRIRVFLICFLLIYAIDIIWLQQWDYTLTAISLKIDKVKFTYFGLISFFILALCYKSYKKNIKIISKKRELDKINIDASREDLVRKLFDKVTNAQNLEESAVFGIEGEWGIGKTTFMKCLYNKLEKDLINKKIILTWFDPWFFKDEEQLIINFFKHIQNSINKHYFFAQIISLEKYGEQLSSISSTNSLLRILKKSFTKDFTESIEERFFRVNQAIEDLHIHLVVFIDDLDRLNSKEVSAMLKLIRLSANFKNTTYIVAYDKNYIRESVRLEINPYESSKFSEKIFRNEIRLPPFSGETLFSVFKGHLKNKISNVHFTKIDNYQQDYVFDLLKNHRDVDRLVDSFLLTYNHMRSNGAIDNIDILDLLQIEIIKVKFITLYTNIFFHKYEFTRNKKRSYSSGIKINDESITTGKEEDFNLDNYLESFKTELKDDFYNVRDLINQLFFRKPLDLEHTSKFSIKEPNHFNKYFNLNLSNREINLKDYNEFLSKDPSKPSVHASIIQHWVKNGKADFLIWMIDKNTKLEGADDYYFIIMLLLHIRESLERFDPAKTYKIYHVIEVIKKYSRRAFSEWSIDQNVDGLNKFLDTLKIINKSSTVCLYLTYITRTNPYEVKENPLQLIEKERNNLFELSLKESPILDKETIEFYNEIQSSKGDRDFEALKKIFIDFIKNVSSERFLQLTIDRKEDKKSHSIYFLNLYLIYKLYSNLEEFEEFAIAVNLNEDMKKEYCTFYNEFFEINPPEISKPLSDYEGVYFQFNYLKVV
ncbi:P-loop NTPase fold protein [Porifericola rhodea]|uniref:KAP family P-loop NTPase fold protein n=1 Tax=Porifericola rhodea TaxID=930972 RepID=UPI002665B4D5|nr:P-loop NTPase fold protein [Porifericola rhodea]WKN32107.1 P-loop NTPase fold protein [Porifericola rhodea]